MNKESHIKRIAFFIGSLTIGGVEKVLITYINTLANKGFNVACIVCNTSSLDTLLSDKVKLINLGVNRLRNSILPLSKVLSSNLFDIVVCSNIQTLFIYLVKKMTKSQFYIVTSHHFYCNNVETPFYYKILLRFVYNRCDLVLAVSDGIKKELIDVLRVNKQLIDILNNPIDIEYIFESSQETISIFGNNHNLKIVWVGRMNVVKNLELLIETIVDLRNMYNNISLHLIGDGEDRGTLENYVKNRNASDYIFFYGIKKNPYPFINMSDIVVLSSSSEAYPTILLEALCLGKTCVSTPTHGAKDILVNGKYGYISNSFTIADFKEALEKAMNKRIDSELLINYSRGFDKKEKVDKFIKLVSDLNNKLKV